MITALTFLIFNLSVKYKSGAVNWIDETVWLITIPITGSWEANPWVWVIEFRRI